jgi:hypothetical protein
MKGNTMKNIIDMKYITKQYINNKLTTIELLNVLIDDGKGYNEFIRIYKIRAFIKSREGFNNKVELAMIALKGTK